MILYNKAHEPPAPVLPIVIANIANRRLRRTVSALLDTGSDVTAIPQSFLSPLQLYPVAKLTLEGVDAIARDTLYICSSAND